MSKSKRNVEVANLVINFGKTGLLDNFEKTIFPTIQNRTAKGRGEANEYRFHRPMLRELGEESLPVLTGRLIALMNLRAVQEYDRSKDELIDSPKTMTSAPSSFFTIDLANHRMIWMREAPRAPTLKQFERVLSMVLRDEMKQRREQHKRQFLAKRNRHRLTAPLKKELEEELNSLFPFPTIRVTPLPAIREIDESLARLKKIERIQVKPLETNNELPDENEEFLRKHYEQAQRLNGSSYVPFFSQGQEGLNHQEAKRLAKAASDGNYQVKLWGQTEQGDKIAAEIEQLSITLPLDIQPGELDQDLAEKAFQKLYEAQKNGWLHLPRRKSELVTKARNVIKSILDKQKG